MMKSLRFLFQSILILGLIIVSFASAVPAHASTGHVFTVNTTVTASDANCSLSEAIAAANSSTPSTDCPSSVSAAINTINFHIPNTDANYASGVYKITLSTPLSVTVPVVIDGTTQPGYSTSPVIRIDGDGGNQEQMLLDTGSDASTLKGLMFTNATWDAVWVNANNVTLTGNYFNTDGLQQITANSPAGVELMLANYATIGGNTSAARNIFSGNTGIQIDGGSNNLIQGNYFGVRADGKTPITNQTANTASGAIYAEVALSTIPSANTIRGNVITGFGNGINLMDQVNSTLIAGNIIGLGSDGSTVLGMDVGILLAGASGNTIGGTTAADRNVIAGNSGGNIYVDTNLHNPNNNIIQGNYIGTNAAGTSIPYPGTSDGIYVTSGDGNQIGGTAAGSGNLISGQSEGITLTGNSTNTQVYGNLIGTDVTGTSALPNGDGIRIINSGVTAAIGSASTAGMNLISGNGGNGILIQNTTSGVTIFGNRIGVNMAGNAGLQNTYDGIYVGNSSAQIGSNWLGYNQIGLSVDDSSSLVNPSGNNCITNSVLNGVIGQNTTTAAYLEQNWWGDVSGPSGVGSGSGDSVTANVDYANFLTTPPSICTSTVSLSAPSLSFGNQLVGTGRTQTITLTNNGGKQLNITSIVTTAPFGLTGSTCPVAGGTLGSGSSCNIVVKFAPTATGAASANVTLTTDASTSPDTIALSGSGVAGTQLLKNQGFELDANLDNKPDNWLLANFNLNTDARDCTVKKSGSCSLRFAGNGLQKTATETILKNGVAGDDFTFSLWSKSTSVPAAAAYSLQVQFYNGAILLSTQTLPFNKGTHFFQQVKGTFTAPGSYTKVVFKIIFKGSAGTVWFDAASLLWAQ
jgi:hypothetical protein